MLSIKLFRTSCAFIFLLLFASGCALPLPEPTSSESALLFLSFQYQEKVAFTTGEGGLLHVSAYVKRIGPDGTVKVISQGSHRGKYFFFPNIEPGTYEIVEIVRTLPGGTNTAQVAALNYVVATATTTFARRDGSFKFSPDVVKQTTVSVKPCSIVYMGEFSGKVRMPLLVTGAITVLSADGRRTSEDENEAQVFLAQTFPDSAWKKCRSPM